MSRVIHHRRRAPDEEQTQLYDRVTKLQTVIIESISKLKKQKKYNECKHYLNMPQDCQEYDHNINYYEKFWKMYLMNEICIVRVDQLKKYVTNQADEVVKVESLFEKHEKLVNQRCKRKSRRTAQEIQRKYSCPYHSCYKVYGSDVSLNLHIKLKHKGGSKTDREKAAECIIEAVQKGDPIPRFRIQLPPGFVEDCVQGLNQNQLHDKRYDNDIFEEPCQNALSPKGNQGLLNGEIGRNPINYYQRILGKNDLDRFGMVQDRNHSPILDDSENL